MNNKSKVKIFIDSKHIKTKAPVNLELLSDFFDYIASKFIISSIDIQLNEFYRPSDFYFEFLSNLCKAYTSFVKVDDYLGEKRNSIFTINSFDYINIFIDNSPSFEIVYDNKKNKFNSLQDLINYLSVLN